MADGSQTRVLPLLLVAALLTALVSVVRVVGEIQGWDGRWFGADAGGALSPFGIVWLVPVFGFMFGRRLAQAGRPAFVASFFVPAFGVVALIGAGVYLGTQFEGEELRKWMGYLVYLGPALALLALFAWPRAFLANLGYGVLARIPVMVIQWLDLKNGWQTHYGKVHPKLPANLTADDRLMLLTLAQGTLWIPFTVLLGGAFAALGAATVRRS
jgi:hypothetical protein